MGYNCKTNDIVTVRRGNDIKITWSLYTNPVDLKPYNLDGKKVDVYLKSRYCIEKVRDISISGNTVTFFFYGKDQKHIGQYSMELVVNEGAKGMYTFDECLAFELVRCACDADGSGGEGASYVTSFEFSTYKQIDVIVDFYIDEDMILNLTHISGEDMNDTFTIDDEGQLILNQAYD